MDATFRALVEPPIALLAVQGELDLKTRLPLTNRLRELEAAPIEVVYLDAAQVTFVDCSCLREIDRSRRRLSDSGRRLEIVATSPTFLVVAHLAQYEHLSATDLDEPPATVVRWLSRRAARR
jgi:anti-anti-sigma factor